MKPALVGTKQNSENSSTYLSSRIWLKGKGCLAGTVPIIRITKDDLIRHKNMPSLENATFDAQLVAVR